MAEFRFREQISQKKSGQVRNSLMQRVTRWHRADFDVVIWELILESQRRF
jgi:hypothetical protein